MGYGLRVHQKEIVPIHPRKLFADDPKRGERLTLQAAGIHLDYSKNRITDETAAVDHQGGIDEGVPTPVLTTALYERFSSRGNAKFQDKLLSAMRYEFGRHVEKSVK
jgi:hypothetical protein